MVKIRTATINDLASIYEIDHLTNPAPWSKENLRQSLKQDLGFVYQSGAAPSAFLLCADRIDFNEILLIATHPAWRRQGQAQQLLEYFFSYHQKEQQQKIFLEVKKNNLAAIALYEKLGFNKESIRKNYYSDHSDALIYVKTFKG